MTRERLDLSTFDGRLLEGLDFCRRVYDLFDQVRRGPTGASNLRLRQEKLEKRLVEELIPIARYVQARYQEGRRIKVRWFSGSQPYDAILWSSGMLVTQHDAPRKVLVEVTTSVHENDYLKRQYLEGKGGGFGVKGISRDKRTREIVSEPHVYTNDELAVDLSHQILLRLRSKTGKKYPPATVLIIDCVPNVLPLDETEWNDAIERVRNAELHLAFREVFLLQRVMSYSTTLFGDQRKRRAARRRTELQSLNT